MKNFIILNCLLMVSLVAGVKTKQTSLEDIERDNLKTEKKPIRTGSAIQATLKQPQSYTVLPTRTASDYERLQPRNQYLQAQYVPQGQYVPQSQYVPQQHFTPPPKQYHAVPPQIQSQVQQPQYQVTPQQFYYTQPQQYQQYENVQYIQDNSITQQPQVTPQQQYYTQSTPQYLYLQQYAAPSTNIQAVIDPKGNVQYIMYIPTYVPRAEQTQNYESVVYVNAPPGGAESDPLQQYTTRYASVPSSEEYQVTPTVKYAPEAVPEPKTRYHSAKNEPKSLLDSYVPSVLQIQYLKQQQAQAQANALQQSFKAPLAGKLSEQSKRHFRSGLAQAESAREFSYQIPKV